MMKVEWSDKSINDLEKTYSEIYEFNKQLNNLFPNELTEANSIQLDFKEDQKEDFVKEIPQVTDFCSKIATLPKQVCESEFLKSFFLKKSRVKQSKATNVNHPKQSDNVVEPVVLKSASNQNETATSIETNKENVSMEKSNNSEQLLVETKKNNIHSKVNTSTKHHQIAESSASLTSTNDLINTTTNQNKNSNSNSQNAKKHSLANGNQNQVNITFKPIIYD
jgi:hypothetical protein